MRRATVSAEAFTGERLVHHAEDRLAVAHQADQRAPGRHSGDEGFGAVDRVEHPDILGVRTLAAVFLADDAVIRKGAADEGAHRGFGRVIGGGHRIEAAGPALVRDAQRGAEEWQDGFAGDGREFAQESRKIDRRHALSPAFRRRLKSPQPAEFELARRQIRAPSVDLSCSRLETLVLIVDDHPQYRVAHHGLFGVLPSRIRDFRRGWQQPCACRVAQSKITGFSSSY